MKNQQNITRKYQIGYMLGRHGISILLCLTIQVIGIMRIYQFDFMRIIFAILFAFLHFYILCNGAKTLANGDLQSYNVLDYNIKWSVLWGVLISLISLLFVILYNLNWKFFSNGVVMNNSMSIVGNILFYVLESPYMAFMYGLDDPSRIPVYLTAIIGILPVAATVCGYYLGRNEYDIIEKFRKIMFEKSEDEE